MEQFRIVLVVDADYRRRAKVCSKLSSPSIHVEPFEEPQDLARRWPANGLVLIHDTADWVENVIRRMYKAGRPMPVIAYSDAPTVERTVKAILDGALDYLAFPFEPAAFDRAMRRTIEADSQLGLIRQRRAQAINRLDRLTPREREVLDMMLEGMSNREMGERLSLSSRTVEIHRGNLLKKAGARTSAQAILMGYEAALVA